MLINEIVVKNKFPLLEADLIQGGDVIKHKGGEFEWNELSQDFTVNSPGMSGLKKGDKVPQGTRQEWQILRSAGIVKSGDALAPTLKTRFKNLFGKGAGKTGPDNLKRDPNQEKQKGFFGKIGQDISSQDGRGFGRKAGAAVGSAIGQALGGFSNFVKQVPKSADDRMNKDAPDNPDNPNKPKDNTGGGNTGGGNTGGGNTGGGNTGGGNTGGGGGGGPKPERKPRTRQGTLWTDDELDNPGGGNTGGGNTGGGNTGGGNTGGGNTGGGNTGGGNTGGGNTGGGNTGGGGPKPKPKPTPTSSSDRLDPNVDYDEPAWKRQGMPRPKTTSKGFKVGDQVQWKATKNNKNIKQGDTVSSVIQGMPGTEYKSRGQTLIVPQGQVLMKTKTGLNYLKPMNLIQKV